jgi:hypothetical protein
VTSKDRIPITVPNLPEPAGPNAARANFYREAASAFEVLALWHSMSKDRQQELRDLLMGAATTVANEQSENRS